jgi:putative nucleotidyltransferase with HDIG domain
MNIMEPWIKSALENFENYIDSFSGLSVEQQKNFETKKSHTLRVLANSRLLAGYLNLNTAEDEFVVVLAAVYHDIGRFPQIAEYNTLDDTMSLDHAELAVKILKENEFLADFNEEIRELIFSTILFHNKLELPKNLSEKELIQTRLLRDADKLDILKVLTDYYFDKNQPANNLLTWELPSSPKISDGVFKEIISGKLVSKKEVKTDTDIKIMQLSWVYDINFKITMNMIFKNRYLEKIYNSLPKTDRVIEIYRKIKVFAENKMME